MKSTSLPLLKFCLMVSTMFSSWILAEEIKSTDSLLKVELDQKVYKLGAEVHISIKEGKLPAGVKAEDIKFRCHVYAYVDGKGYREVVPSLEANAPKQMEPIYTFSTTKSLVWSYKNKPEYFQPKVSRHYMIVLEFTHPSNSPMAYSQSFIFE